MAVSWNEKAERAILKAHPAANPDVHPDDSVHDGRRADSIEPVRLPQSAAFSPVFAA